MAVLLVLKYPDAVLKTRAKEVKEITGIERALVRDMIDTMYAEKGVGLAANQVGVLKRIFVASADQVRGQELVYFNPVLVKKEGVIKEFEGCLSVPEFYEPVKRAKTVWMRALTPEGKPVEVKGEGLLARIFQHEIDHLNGVLFIDHLSFLKGRRIKKKLSRRATASKA